MKKITSESKSYLSNTFTGMVVGFLGAAVLYQKKFPNWVPSMFSENPILFFITFVVICGGVGYVWALADEIETNQV